MTRRRTLRLTQSAIRFDRREKMGNRDRAPSLTPPPCHEDLTASTLGLRAVARRVRIELDSGEVVSESCLIADNPWLRLRGLMFQSSLEAGHGLLIRPCSSIHTSFMRFPIDVVFCNRDLQVLEVAASVRPWRLRA